MSDAELIARLRDGCNLQQRDGERAASRIEALTKERDEQIEWVKRLADDLIAAEAKLAKAVQKFAALEKAASDVARRGADRIEVLTKERDDYAHKLMQANNTYTEMHLEIERLSDKLATCEKYRDAYDEMGRIGTQAVRDIEGKLAKAVEALSDLMMHEPDHPDTIWEKARTTLAEIRGESHE